MTTLVSTDLPTRATMWHDESTILVGSALLHNVSAFQIFNFIDYQNPPANGDTFTQSFFVRAGIYNFSILGITYNNNGLIDWFLDGNRIITGQDWYSAAGTFNVVKTLTGLSVPFDGKHVLRASINGKNVASSNYFAQLTKMWFYQGAD